MSLMHTLLHLSVGRKSADYRCDNVQKHFTTYFSTYFTTLLCSLTRMWSLTGSGLPWRQCSPALYYILYYILYYTWQRTTVAPMFTSKPKFTEKWVPKFTASPPQFSADAQFVSKRNYLVTWSFQRASASHAPEAATTHGGACRQHAGAAYSPKEKIKKWTVFAFCHVICCRNNV